MLPEFHLPIYKVCNVSLFGFPKIFCVFFTGPSRCMLEVQTYGLTGKWVKIMHTFIFLNRITGYMASLSLHLLTIYCGHSCHMCHGDSLGLSSCIQGKTWPAACEYKYIFLRWLPRGLRLFIWHRYINHIIFGNHVIVKISR